jgi:hypothetical protein
VAHYIPAGRRRRRLVVVGVVAVVVGLVVGAVLGRATAPTLSDQISSVRSDAQSLDARLQALPLEYEKSLSGSEEFSRGGGPADALVGISADAAALARRATWLNDAQRGDVTDAIDQAQQVATAKGSAADFEAAVSAASAAVTDTFGLTRTTTTTGS